MRAAVVRSNSVKAPRNFLQGDAALAESVFVTAVGQSFSAPFISAMLSLSRLEGDARRSSFLATCSAFSRRPGLLGAEAADGRARVGRRAALQSLAAGAGLLAAAGRAVRIVLLCCLSCPGSYFSLPTRAGVLRP